MITARKGDVMIRQYAAARAALLRTGLVSMALIAGSPARAQTVGEHTPTRFEIVYPASANQGPITGRVYVMITRTNDTEPRLQVGRTGIPFFGHDVERLKPGEAATIDGKDIGFPIDSLGGIPPGDYYVQGFINVYSEFKRADGHTVWMHDDRWEGQHWRISPGNLHSDVQRVHLDPAQGYAIRLEAKTVIPPVEIPPDTEWVKRFRFQSPSLTKFWGRPIYLGATVLLPKDYDRTSMSYPVLYRQGHFGLRDPLGFDRDTVLARDWMRDDFPRVIAVSFQHPNPYFDDSYGVNSLNVGPYGDAIMNELIPEVEKRFRTISEPWARWLDGGSTGGWESLALQVFHPDFFGGTWSYCPDPVTFTNVEGYNIYEDENAYVRTTGWVTVDIPNSRNTDGSIRTTSRQRNYYELASGTHGRSGEQQDIWQAVYGPIGEDGYFKPLYDKRSGKIDRQVAEYWRDHYDILDYLKRNWSEIGPKLVDKIHIYTGTMDTYYLDVATRQLEDWMRTTESPHYEGTFLYGVGKPHCWSGPVTLGERIKEMAQHGMRHMPEPVSTPWWKY